jgi:hypothetical protein
VEIAETESLGLKRHFRAPCSPNKALVDFFVFGIVKLQLEKESHISVYDLEMDIHSIHDQFQVEMLKRVFED